MSSEAIYWALHQNTRTTLQHKVLARLADNAGMGGMIEGLPLARIAASVRMAETHFKQTYEELRDAGLITTIEAGDRLNIKDLDAEAAEVTGGALQ